MNIKHKARILFIGDSITDSNRDRNAKPGSWNSFGDGYVELIHAYTTGILPKQEFMIINKGNSGDRILDLEKRWQEDVLDLHPDIVTIMIGVNDVWRHFDSVFQQEEQVSIDQFAEIYEKIIRETLTQTKQIIIMSAFMIESNINDLMRKQLTEYNAVSKELAEKYQLTYIDIQTLIDQFLIYQSSYILSVDRVHPSLPGHMIIAEKWLSVVRFLEVS